MTTNTFRILLAASISLGVIGMIVDIATEQLLPPLLQLHLEGWDVVGGELGDPTHHGAETLNLQLQYDDTISFASTSVFLVGMLGAIAGYIGLFRLRTWGAWTMLVITVIIMLAPISSEPATGWANMLYGACALLHFLALAMIFLGPMRPVFFDEGLANATPAQRLDPLDQGTVQ